MRMTPVKLLAVLIISIVISGCASVILHPIEKSDITKMPKAIAYTPEKNGWFISDYYLEQVVKAKVEK